MIKIAAGFNLNKETLISVDALLAIISIVYPFWPLILLFGLSGLFSKELPFKQKVLRFFYRGFLAWFMWLIFLGLLIWQGRSPIMIMPIKVNNLLFFIYGGFFGFVSIVLVVRYWGDRWIKLVNAQKIEDLLALSPEDFEALVAALFRAYGHQAQVSGGTADHGIDVIIQTEEGEKWIVQCKRYKGSVGEPVIRDLYGTMLHEEAQKAYLVTTGSFTSQAVVWAGDKPIILYDGEKLIKLIRRTQKRKPKLKK